MTLFRDRRCEKHKLTEQLLWHKVKLPSSVTTTLPPLVSNETLWSDRTAPEVGSKGLNYSENLSIYFNIIHDWMVITYDISHYRPSCLL